MIRKAFGKGQPLIEQLLYSKRFVFLSVAVFFGIITVPSLIHQYQSRDGGYTIWSKWTDCSVTCGGGIQGRERRCTNPVPSSFGKHCRAIGPQIETKLCTGPPCLVHGDWGFWKEWVCEPNCIGGKQTRTRACDKPAPSNGGRDCENKEHAGKEVGVCDTLLPCPINGGYSEWGAWTKCTKTCGRGLHERSRLCNKPEPKNGGKSCEGNPHEVVVCEVKPCIQQSTPSKPK